MPESKLKVKSGKAKVWRPPEAADFVEHLKPKPRFVTSSFTQSLRDEVNKKLRTEALNATAAKPLDFFERTGL